MVACLAMNQAFYVIGAIGMNDDPPNGSVENLPNQRAADEPHNRRDDGIRRHHERQQNTQLNLAQQSASGWSDAVIFEDGFCQSPGWKS
jgi:hypothetical protein